jgi:hypothetical protein
MIVLINCKIKILTQVALKRWFDTIESEGRRRAQFNTIMENSETMSQPIQLKLFSKQSMSSILNITTITKQS